jgi:hypothetical protein
MSDDHTPEAERFWNEWFDPSTLPDDLKRKLSYYDMRRLGQRAHTILLGMAEDIERKAN